MKEKRKDELINEIIEEKIFEIRNKEEMYLSKEFKNVLEKVMELAKKNPQWLISSIHGERNFQKAKKKGLTSVYLFAYLCFRFNKDPMNVESFEIFDNYEEKEIEEKLTCIMAWHEACKEIKESKNQVSKNE